MVRLRMVFVLFALALPILACNLAAPAREVIRPVAQLPTSTLVRTQTPTPTTVPQTQSAQNSQQIIPVQQNQPAAQPCQPTTAWPTYIVMPGDTLSSIAARTGSSVQALAIANCLANANRITVGQRLYVPRQPHPPNTPVPPSPWDDNLSLCYASALRSVEIYNQASGTSGSVLGVLPGGGRAAVLAFQQYRNNYEIVYNSIRGWVDGAALSLYGDCRWLVPLEYQNVCIAYTEATDIWLRTFLDGNGTPPLIPQYQMPPRVWVEVLAFVNTPGDIHSPAYYKVRIPSNMEGWIPQSAVQYPEGRIAGPCNTLPTS